MLAHVRFRGALIALLLSVCPALSAATYMPMSDADLIRLAPSIVRAEVVDQSVRLQSVDSEDLPFTIVTLQILESFKGAVDEKTLRLRLPGGATGDDAWSVPGAPPFEIGQEVVLMVDAIPDDFHEHRLTEFGLSKFDLIADETGRRFAVRAAFSAEADLRLSRVELALETQAAGAFENVPARDAESFLSALRALRRGDELPPIALAIPTGRFEYSPGGGFRPQWTNLGGSEPSNEFRWFWDTGASPTATVVIHGTQSKLSKDDTCGTDSVCYVQSAVTGWHGVAETDVHLEGPSATGNLKLNLDAEKSHDGGLAWSTPFPCEGGVIGLAGPDRSHFAGSFKGDTPFYAIPGGTASFRKDGCPTGMYSGRVFHTVVLHEMGHTLGLGHPGVDPAHREGTSLHSTTDSSTWETAVMHWSVPDLKPSTPQDDDIQAMQYFYGTATPGPVPVADFEYVEDPTVPIQVRFSDTSSNSPTGFAWDFGDPLSGDENVVRYQSNPYHFFSSPGSYTVTLIAGNSNGSGMTSKTVVVTEVPRVPPTWEPRVRQTSRLTPRSEGP